MNTERTAQADLPPDDQVPDAAASVDAEMHDADWLRKHREMVINHFVLRAGGGPSADRKTRRQAQVNARRIYRRMVRDAVGRGRGGGGG